jgi:hypothetical protein
MALERPHQPDLDAHGDDLPQKVVRAIKNHSSLKVKMRESITSCHLDVLGMSTGFEPRRSWGWAGGVAMALEGPHRPDLDAKLRG